jgi:hypothetical protein
MAKVTLDPNEWDFLPERKNGTGLPLLPSELEFCLSYEYAREALRQPYVAELRRQYRVSKGATRADALLEMMRVLRKLPPAAELSALGEEPKPWLALSAVEKRSLLGALKVGTTDGKPWASFRGKVPMPEPSIDVQFATFTMSEDVFFMTLCPSKARPVTGFFAIDRNADYSKVCGDFGAWLKMANILTPRKTPRPRAGDKKRWRLLRGLGALRLRNAHGGDALTYRSVRDDPERPVHAEKRLSLRPPNGRELPYSFLGDFMEAADEAEARLIGLLGRDDPLEREDWRKAGEGFRARLLAGEFGTFGE